MTNVVECTYSSIPIEDNDEINDRENYKDEMIVWQLLLTCILIMITVAPF